MNREYTIATSLLRDHHGFKNRALNKMNDLYIRSDFTINNNQYEDNSINNKGIDGSTVLLDGRVVFHHLGQPNDRQYSITLFRSAYEAYSAGSESCFTASRPSLKGVNDAGCLDYLFYSYNNGLIVSKVLCLPELLLSKRGETPDRMLLNEDYIYSKPFEIVKSNYNEAIEAVERKVAAGAGGGGGGFLNNGKREQIAVMKRMLKDILTHDDEYTLTTIQVPAPILTTKEDEPSAGVSGNGGAGAAGDASPSKLKKQGTMKRGKSSANVMNDSSGGGNEGLRASVSSSFLVPTPEPTMITQEVRNTRFWGGNWVPFPNTNPSRSNYHLPNAIYGSSHLAVGAEFVFDENKLANRAW
jgi:hypothetical protein